MDRITQVRIGEIRELYETYKKFKEQADAHSNTLTTLIQGLHNDNDGFSVNELSKLLGMNWNDVNRRIKGKSK